MNDHYQSQNRGYPEYGPGTCVFHKKTERIDWKKLAMVDIDKTIRENDIKVLYENLKNIAFCDVENELDVHNSDRNLIKMFKLAQLTIDYLLTSQDYLAKELNNSEERCKQVYEDMGSIKTKILGQEDFINDIKRECHRRKKIIKAQQQIMDSGPNTYHRCPFCEKAFLNATFLRNHLVRRHNDRFGVDTYHLSLNNSVRLMESPTGGHRGSNDELRKSLREDERIDHVLQVLLDMRQQQQQMETPRDGSRINHDRCNDEMNQLHNRYTGEINQMQLRIESLERKLLRYSQHSPRHSSQYSPRHSPKRNSNLGDLTDEVDNKEAHLARINAIKNRKEDNNAEIARKTAIRNKKNTTKVTSDLSKALGCKTTEQIVTLSPTNISSSTTCIDELENVSVSLLQNDIIENTVNKSENRHSEHITKENYTHDSNNKSNIETNTFSSSSTSTSSTFDVSLTKTATIKQNNGSAATHQISHFDSPDSGKRVNTTDNYRDQSITHPISPFIEQKMSLADLNKMKLTVINTLTSHLEDHGISSDTSGIKDSDLADKLDIFNQEKHQLLPKYPNFERIRRELVNWTERKAADQMNRRSMNNSQEFGSNPHLSVNFSGEDRSPSVAKKVIDPEADQKEIYERKLEELVKSAESTSNWQTDPKSQSSNGRQGHGK